MPRLRSPYLCVFALCAILCPSSYAADTPGERPARTYLHKNWQIQSSCEVKAAGEQISSAGFDAKGWHNADVPATVVGALVTDKTFPDPNYGTNLKSLPGMNYSDKKSFCQSGNAGRESISLLVVVSHGVHHACRRGEENGVVEFSGHQLPG